MTWRTPDKDGPIPTRASLTTEHKEYMLAHLLRLPVLFGLAREELKAAYFSLDERPYSVLWQAALNLSDRYLNKMPEQGAQRRLELEIKSLLSEDPTALLPSEEAILFGSDGQQGFVDWAYSISEKELYDADGRTLLKTYLEERTVVAPLKEYVFSLGERNPADLSSMLRKVEEKQGLITSMTDTRAIPAFPLSGYQPISLNLLPTSMSFLDDSMDGGQAAGEIYFLFGPTGVGKTTLGLQIAYQGAVYQQLLAQEGKELGHWYYFTYEQGVDPEIWHRIWSHSSWININTFRKGETFSTSDKLKPYERKRYEKELTQGLRVPGEQERYDATLVKLNPLNFWLFDMSGSDKNNPQAGKGGISEIERLLANEQRQGRRVAGFVIDYATLICDRYLAAKGISDDKKLYHELSRFGDNCRRRLAAQFACPGWLLHQLSGAANKKSPTAKQHHSDAALCKSMADNASFAFNLGTKDLGTSTCRLTCSKTRRAAGSDKEQIIFINGQYCTMQSTDNRYVFDYRSNRIIPSSMNERVVRDGVDSAKKKTAANPANAAGMWPRDLDMS